MVTAVPTENAVAPFPSWAMAQTQQPNSDSKLPLFFESDPTGTIFLEDEEVLRVL